MFNGSCHLRIERTVLLKYLKIYLDTDLKINFIRHQNNYVEYLNIDDVKG